VKDADQGVGQLAYQGSPMKDEDQGAGQLAYRGSPMKEEDQGAGQLAYRGSPVWWLLNQSLFRAWQFVMPMLIIVC